MGKLTDMEIESRIAEIVRQIKYDAYLQSRAWKNIRIAKLTEVNFKCQVCGYGEYEFQDGALDVHHKTYINFGNEKLGDLEVLCRSCHQKKHGRRF